MPAWKPSCLRPANDCLPRTSKETDPDDLTSERRQTVQRRMSDDVAYGITALELYRRDPESGLGVVITGGADQNEYPRISQIRPGSLADRSDVLECGDYLVSVNGVQTAKLAHDDVINLLRHAGKHLRLEIKFPLPTMPSSKHCVQKETSIPVMKENESFGLTIRGGGQRPFILTRIRPGSPADRDGLFRVGDRIVAVDGVTLDGMTHAQMIGLLQRAPHSARFTLQYDVQIIDAVLNANSALFVEIDRAGGRMGTGKPLGMQIQTSRISNDRLLVIDSIVPASIADRCGALSAGDRILTIDGTPCENMTIPEAIQLLESAQTPTLNMLILPASVIKKEQTAQSSTGSSSSGALAHHPLITRNVVDPVGFGTRTIMRSQSPPPLPRPPENFYTPTKPETSYQPHKNPESSYLAPKKERFEEVAVMRQIRQPEPVFQQNFKRDDDASSDGSLYEKTSSTDENTDGLSFLVTIERRKKEPWGIGFAYKRQGGLSDILLQSLEPGGVAQRTEALKVGDIIVSINGRPMRNQNLGDAYWHLNSYDIATLKILRKNEPKLQLEARHSPAESANSTASVDSAIESWESNLRPQPRQNNFSTIRPQRQMPHSVSAHHVAEVESVSLSIRGSESIPERLDYDVKPPYRDAENLKNSIEMMDQILSLNDCMSEKRTVGTTKSTQQSSSSQSTQNQNMMLDSLLEDLALMRTQPSVPPTTRRVKFQTPNGHASAPAVASTGKSSVFEISLAKDPYYEDFGFSLSDGAFERGVYVNRIRPGGPAQAAGLRPCDQILRVNKADVRDLDCCLAVPLIAASGDEIRLLVSRRTLNRRIVKGDESDDDRGRDHGVDVLESDML